MMSTVRIYMYTISSCVNFEKLQSQQWIKNINGTSVKNEEEKKKPFQ